MLSPFAASSSHRARSSEQGSVVLAVMVMMILLLLGFAIVTRGQRQLVATSNASDAAAAEAGAEQGVAEAVALLDSGQRGDFSGSGVLVGGTYSFTVSEVSPTRYVATAFGQVGDTRRAIEATIGGEAVDPDQPYSLLIDTSGSFGDNRWPINGRTASNGPLDASSSTSPGDQVDLFGPDASCTGCPATTAYPDPRDIPLPVVPSTGRSCPRNGRFTGSLDGQNGVPYVCSSSNVRPPMVTFANNITISNPPLVVYVRIGKDVRFNGASVNIGGDPVDFQLFAEGDDDYWQMDASNSQIFGQIYGPGRDSLMGNVELTGSLTVGSLEIRPDNDMRITPSPSTTPSGPSGTWVVTSWERVSAR